ncbi:MAG: ABC transporter ATP-binding protein [Deltaproteobacteria bacterium]|nr:ABC transporter ATP-binding protein [Deltaproteobacteria bacterium]
MSGTIFKVNDLSYTYPGGLAGLHDINFSVSRGENIAFLGVNGSGKSTLLKLIDGLYFPNKGTIAAFGEPLTEQQLRDEEFAFAFRRRVGFLFQDPDSQLFLPTVWQEVAFSPLQMGLAKEEAAEKTNAALKALGIEKLKDRIPYQLSEGEKKKVALASLLALDPEVWLLDEPTANLDPRTQDWVIEFILSLAEKGKTLVVAIHELEVAKVIAHRAYILGEDHSLAAQGDPREILQDEELLLRVNLMHRRRHCHPGLTHRHPYQHSHQHPRK